TTNARFQRALSNVGHHRSRAPHAHLNKDIVKNGQVKIQSSKIELPLRLVEETAQAETAEKAQNSAS
ncbi:MAG TPA: hypothetical protein VEK33_16235, partial [Terriglobales bacterium]|nr:hypothetical protein [Terriglobales bacterium]